jgi:hypothetical protein
MNATEVSAAPDAGKRRRMKRRVPPAEWNEPIQQLGVERSIEAAPSESVDRTKLAPAG